MVASQELKLPSNRFQAKLKRVAVLRQASFSDIGNALAFRSSYDLVKFQSSLSVTSRYFALAKSCGRTFRESFELMLNWRLSDPLSLSFALGGQSTLPDFTHDHATNKPDASHYREAMAYIMVNNVTSDAAETNVKISYHKLNDGVRRAAKDILRHAHRHFDWDEFFRIVFILDIMLSLSGRGMRRMLFTALEPFFDDYPGVANVRLVNSGTIYRLIADSFSESQAVKAAPEYLRFDVLKETTSIYKNVAMLQMFSETESRLYSFYSSSGRLREDVEFINRLIGGELLSVTDKFYEQVYSLLSESLSESFDKLGYPDEKRKKFVDGLASSILTLAREHDEREFIYKGRSIQKSSLNIPAIAPMTWKSDRQDGETAPEFIMRAYNEWHGHGLTLMHVRKLDEPLVQALYYHMRKGLPLPEGFDLPTKPQQNDRDLVMLREKAEITVPENADAEHVFREIERLRQAEIRRKRREL